MLKSITVEEFNRLVNDVKLSVRNSAGKLFNVIGPAIAKLRLPMDDKVAECRGAVAEWF